MKRRRAVVAIVLLAALGACGRRREGSDKNSSGGPSQGSSPESTAGAEAFWNAWRRAVVAGDGRALWTMTCSSNRARIIEKTRTSMSSMPQSEWIALASMTGQAEARLREMPAEMLAEETTVSILNRLRERPGELEKVERSEFLGADADGARTVIRFRLKDGREMTLAVVMEGGEWKTDLEATARSAGKK